LGAIKSRQQSGNNRTSQRDNNIEEEEKWLETEPQRRKVAERKLTPVHFPGKKNPADRRDNIFQNYSQRFPSSACRQPGLG